MKFVAEVFRTEDDLIDWLYSTVRGYGALRSTALDVCALFARGFEDGRLAIPSSDTTTYPPTS